MTYDRYNYTNMYMYRKLLKIHSPSIEFLLRVRNIVRSPIWSDHMIHHAIRSHDPPYSQITWSTMQSDHMIHHTISLVPRPHLQEKVWWHPADSSGFINVDYFLKRNFSPPITLQKTQSVVQHRKFLATSARWHSTFLARKLVISSQLCIQQAMNF